MLLLNFFLSSPCAFLSFLFLLDVVSLFYFRITAILARMSIVRRLHICSVEQHQQQQQQQQQQQYKVQAPDITQTAHADEEERKVPFIFGALDYICGLHACPQNGDT